MDLWQVIIPSFQKFVEKIHRKVRVARERYRCASGLHAKVRCEGRLSREVRRLAVSRTSTAIS